MHAEPPPVPNGGWSGPESARGGGGAAADAAAAAAAEGRAARLELEGMAEERTARLREARRASGEILGIMSVASNELVDEFPDPSALSGSAHPGHDEAPPSIAATPRWGRPAPPPVVALGAARKPPPTGRGGSGGGGDASAARNGSSYKAGTPPAGDKEAPPPAGAAAGAAAAAAAAPSPSPAADGQQQRGGGGGGEGHLLGLIPVHRRLTLAFRNVDGYVPSGLGRPGPAARLAAAVGGGGKGAAAGKGQRRILFGLSGEVLPGRVLALMGPSGSGKTTLLSVLGGRPAKALSIAGAITVNGRPFTKGMRRRIGFVLQDDVLYEDLTVRETLRYAAQLRLPKAMAQSDKERRVEAVITALGLNKSAGTIIGGFLRRGISGGERKRVSIGHELLVDPSILMLDEPTSGLDSTSAMHLIDLLRGLAAEGRAVVSTIHQPSSRMYRQLDSLMLLADGHLVYSGPAADAAAWLEGFGLVMDRGTSVADFLLDAAMGEAGTTRSGNAGPAAIAELWTAWESRAASGATTWSSSAAAAIAPRTAAAPAAQQRLLLTPAANGGGGGGRLLGVANGNGGVASGKAPFPGSAAAAVGESDEEEQKWEGRGGGGGEAKAGGRRDRGGAGYGSQVAVLTERAIKVRRFEQLTGAHFFQLIFVAVIAGLVWWQRGATYTLVNAADVQGLLFFELLFPSFRSLFHALFTLPNEYRMLMKERPSGLYRLSAYYLARAAADLPIELLNTVLFVVIAYWFGGLNRVAADFFANLGAMLLVVLVAEAWGLWLGGIFMNPKKAQTATTVIMLTFLLVGGYYARSIPVWISWLRHLSFLYWGYNILLKIQFRRYPLYDCGRAVPPSSTTGYSSAALASTPGCTPVADVQRALGMPEPPNAPAWPDALILVGMLVALRLGVYWTLRAKTKPRKLLVDKKKKTDKAAA